MKFTLEINMDNAAFADNGPVPELDYIFRQLKKDGYKIEPGRLDQNPVRDTNGNYVGFWQVADGQQAEKPKDKPEIIITMEGGLIQDVDLPKDCPVRIVVMDFDVEGVEEDRLVKNAKGEEYIRSVYEG